MPSTRLLRLPQVIDRTGLGKTKLYELQKDGLFPMRIKITAHAVGWIEEEIENWIAGRVGGEPRTPVPVKEATKCEFRLKHCETLVYMAPVTL